MSPKLLTAYAAKMGPETTPAQAESEITRIIIEVSKNVSKRPKMKFGYHSRADIAQQGAVYALELLNSGVYDVSRPLEGFLYIHVRNRLFNYKRKTYTRSERPCTCCDPFNPPLNPCELWTAWNNRNINKQNIMRPVNIGAVSDEYEKNLKCDSTIEDDVAVNELIELIDRDLPVELRSDYLKLRNGVTIPQPRRMRVRSAIEEILNGNQESDN